MQSGLQDTHRREIRKTALNILLRVLDDYGSTLKLVLGLSTGATVLLINVLANQHLPRTASWLSVASVLFFGAASVLCLLFLVGIAQLQSMMCDALIDDSPNWRQEFDPKMDKWKKAATTLAKLLAWLFGLGLLFAAASVNALVSVR